MNRYGHVFVWSLAGGFGGGAIISRHHLGPRQSVDIRRLSSFVPR